MEEELIQEEEVTPEKVAPIARFLMGREAVRQTYVDWRDGFLSKVSEAADRARSIRSRKQVSTTNQADKWKNKFDSRLGFGDKDKK